jgi:predicted RNase H-like HicB family nuclease
MQYQVLVESKGQNIFMASVIGVPDCFAEGSTEAEAVSKAKAALRSRLAQGKVVTIEMEEPVKKLTGNPWLDSAGVFKDDPTYDEFLAEIAAYRREVDAEEAAREASE